MSAAPGPCQACSHRSAQHEGKPVSAWARHWRALIPCLVGVWAIGVGAQGAAQEGAPQAPSPAPAVKESFLPDDAFPQDRPRGLRAIESVPRHRMRQRGGAGGQCPPGSEVFVYTSEPSQKQLVDWGMDPATGTRQWENALRDLKWRYCRLESAADLDRYANPGLLILPQTALLSQLERAAIARWRSRAGAVLSTWETGTFDENGRPTGPGFMEQVLGVRLQPRQKFDPEQRYVLPFGSNPLLWHNPAGQRMLLENIPRLPPRRLAGEQTAAVLSDWSRNASSTSGAGMVVFGERALEGGRSSRAVALGYPEQAWQRVDPASFATMHSDVLHWLLRKPQAYRATWPWPHQNANVLTVFVRSGALQSAVEGVRSLGTHASLFWPPQEGAGSALPGASAPPGWYSGWAQAPAGEWLHAGRKVPIAASQWRAWGPPTGAAGDTGHALLGMDADETGLPFWLQSATPGDAPLVGLPMTLYPVHERAAAAYLAELELSQRAGALSVVRVDWPLAVGAAHYARVQRLLSKTAAHWLATSSEVAQWWRVRAQVESVALHSLDEEGWELVLSARSAVPAGQMLPVVVTMPSARHNLSAQPVDDAPAVSSVQRLDAWRSVLLFKGVPAGQSRWRLRITAR